jgi:hypothetical protein
MKIPDTPVLHYEAVLVLRTPSEQRAGGDVDPVDVESLKLPDGAVPVLIDFNNELVIGEAFLTKRSSAKSQHKRSLRLYADIHLKTPLEDQRWPSIAIAGLSIRKDGIITESRLVYVGLVARQNIDAGLEPLN